jgi:hypothetical protein
MPLELLLEALLSIFGSNERRHGSFELLTAKCAHRDDRRGTEPLDYPRSGLCNTHKSPVQGVQVNEIANS